MRGSWLYELILELVTETGDISTLSAVYVVQPADINVSWGSEWMCAIGLSTVRYRYGSAVLSVVHVVIINYSCLRGRGLTWHGSVCLGPSTEQRQQSGDRSQRSCLANEPNHSIFRHGSKRSRVQLSVGQRWGCDYPRLQT